MEEHNPQKSCFVICIETHENKAQDLAFHVVKASHNTHIRKLN